MLGAAKTSIRAQKARSPKALNTSLIVMVALGRLARSLRTSENRCRGSGSSSEDGAAARLLEGSGMVVCNDPGRPGQGRLVPSGVQGRPTGKDDPASAGMNISISILRAPTPQAAE